MIFKSDVSGRSLIEQVSLAEQQLQARQVSLHEEVRTFNAALRRRVTAPDVILWSVGSGFILGELTKKRGDKNLRAENARLRADAEEFAEDEAERPGTVQLILHYWNVARPIIATATSILAPLLQAKAAHAGATVAIHEAMHETGVNAASTAQQSI